MKTTRTIVILTTLLCLTPMANTAHRTITTASPSLRAMTQSPFVWQTATPASQGMSKAKLDALRDVLAARKTKAFLVIRNDKIVYEWYAADHGPEKKHGTASLAKAIVGGLSLAVAMTDGRIALDDKAAKFIPQWKSDAQKPQITVRQLGSHTSGLADAEADPPAARATDRLAGRFLEAARSAEAIRSRLRATKHRCFLLPARSCNTAIPASRC